MPVRRHPTNLRRMLASRLHRLASAKPLVQASLATVYRVCGTPSCHCHRGHKHRAVQLTYAERGKRHAVYVPVDMAAEVRLWIEEYRRVKGLLREISQLSLELLRSHVQEQRRRRGRS
jgi:hypothetical protein